MARLNWRTDTGRAGGLWHYLGAVFLRTAAWHP
jgi:hypothetical protein